MEREDGGIDHYRSSIWEGELEIKNQKEYLTMISIHADGMVHPICQVPFAKGLGHYLWIPPDAILTEERDDQWPIT